jgi:hypothetical protein
MTFLNSANRRKTIAGGRQKKEIQSSPFAGWWELFSTRRKEKPRQE